jgi:hypothetical protein
MAIAAATIARGSVPPPMIERGRPSETDAQLDPLAAPVTDRLRTMMRDGMNDPRMEELRMYGGVTAFVAEAGEDGWLIATMGDLAFAVHIDNMDGGDAAVRMAARMFRSFTTPEP